MNRAESTYCKNFLAEIRKEGDALLAQSLPELREEDFYLYKETGNRLVYEGEYFGRRKFLTVFGILTAYEEKQIYLDKLSEVLEAVCEEKIWALPAHVNFEHLDLHTIDLFAAETAQTLTEMVFLFQNQLSDALKYKILQEVIERVLKPFCESAVPYSWWEQDGCNWSAVCAGSIGMAAIQLFHIFQENEDTYDTLEALLPSDWKENCIKRVCDALTFYLGGMEEDGTCTEGLGYFSYGMSYFTGFAEMLYEDSGHQIQLLDSRKCKKIAQFQQKCYFGQGLSISFSDSSQHENFLPGLTTYLSYLDENVEIPDYTLARSFHEDACYRWLTNDRNIRWLQKYSHEKTKHSENTSPKAYYLPVAQWMVYQNAQGNGFAIKGGNNAENHNHNDIGHFLCAYEGEMLLTDLGAGEYTKEYFHEGRYQILCNRALGHSVPLINGSEQLEGREYCADFFVWEQESKTLQVSIAGAYETGVINQINRKMTMVDDWHIAVEDQFVPNQQTKNITENLIVSVKPEILEDTIVLTGKKSTCHIQVMVENQAVQEFEILEYDHHNHDGSLVKVYGIQWNIKLDKMDKKISKIDLFFKKHG